MASSAAPLAVASSDGLTRARALFQATRALSFANLPSVDVKDRISLLSVAAGVRQVGVLETWGQRLPVLRDAAIRHGLQTSIATSVWSTIERPESTPYLPVLQELDRLRVAGKPKHVLWLYSSPELRNELRQQPPQTQRDVGALLGYPACCTAFEAGVMARLPDAQLAALMTEAGTDDDAMLLRLLKRTKAIETGKQKLPTNGLRTEQELPFILHVACDACLEHPNSPSRQLNSQLQEFVHEATPELHQLILTMQTLFREITPGRDENQLSLARIEAAHAAFFARPS